MAQLSNTIHVDEKLCPKYERAVSIIGKRWTPLIIRVLLDRPRRFGEINDIIHIRDRNEKDQKLSDRVLSERLKELEDEGIVQRNVYPETPVRITYSLTPKGRDLQRVIEELQRWGDTWLSIGNQQDTHAEPTHSEATV